MTVTQIWRWGSQFADDLKINWKEQVTRIKSTFKLRGFENKVTNFLLQETNQISTHDNSIWNISKILLHLWAVKDTHREKSPSNKTPALSKSMNMDIWVVGYVTRECKLNV